MADTYTTNLNLTKPEPGAAEDTWGISLNADLDSLDAIFGSGGTAVSMGAVTLDGLTVDGDATIKGGSDVSNTGATLQLESTETQAVGSGASISFKGDDGSGTQRVFGVIKGSKTSATSGEFNGGLDFFTRVTAEGNAIDRDWETY
jgi:hypothetical protein